MPLTLFTRNPPLDEISIEWIFEVFDWALAHLNADAFYQHTLLLTPTNTHFPGSASNAAEMAELIFRHALAYAGMAHWPIRLSHPGEPVEIDTIEPVIPDEPRRFGESAAPTLPTSLAIRVGYDPRLIKNPEAMIAGYAQVLAHYLGAAVRKPPPGGVENWAQTTEVLGVFLGFGVLFVNTASNFRTNTCGSCGGPPVERQVFLSQYDMTYALALFCTLKQIPNATVLPQLKRSLRGYYKRCRNDIKRRDALLFELGLVAGTP
jgi:hypothetical protein